MVSNSQAVESFIKDVRPNEALCALLRTLAAAVDTNPGNAQLVRQYREALKDASETNDNDSALRDAIEAFRGAVGHSIK